MKNILVVDDHAIVNYGTIRILKDFYPSVEVDSAKDADEMVKHLNEKKFDLLLLDINIPGGNNFQILDVIKLRQPNIKILIFSGYDEQMYAHRYLASGAHGYIQKQAPETDLKEAIETIFRNQKYMSAGVKEHLKKENNKESTEEKNPFSTLSNREMEVMQLLREGLSLMEIGVRLNLQLSTVSTYKQRIFEKIAVNNIVELVQKVRLYHIDH